MQWWLNHYGFAPDRIRDLDIGAAIPAHLNNTFLFNSVGACGFLMEPDPDQAAVLRAERPRDVVLQVGVAFDERIHTPRAALREGLSACGYHRLGRY